MAAHEGEPLEPHDLWSAWSFDPLTIVLLLLSGVLYLIGQRRASGLRLWERIAYWVGWSWLVIALVSPLHPLGEALFSAHMIQHEMLMLVAAPLVVLGRPMIAYLWALPMNTRRWIGGVAKGGWLQKSWSFLTEPLHATWIHGLALWIGHAPKLFNATLASDAVHAAQHAMFLGSALLFWWSLIRRANAQAGLAVLYLFGTMLHSGLLGVLLFMSGSPWYERYTQTTQAWGLTALEDQQLGGLIMWVPAGMVYLIAALFFLNKWLQEPVIVYRNANMERESTRM